MNRDPTATCYFNTISWLWGHFIAALTHFFPPFYIVADEPKGLDGNERVKTGIARKTVCFSFVFVEHWNYVSAFK